MAAGVQRDAADARRAVEGPGVGDARLPTHAGGGWPAVDQYWNRHEKLYAYATRPDAEHRPAWTRFNQRARKAPGAVGIWHETFQVDRAESIYAGMPVSGLAKATGAIPVGRRGERAKERYQAGGTGVAA